MVIVLVVYKYTRPGILSTHICEGFFTYSHGTVIILIFRILLWQNQLICYLGFTDNSEIFWRNFFYQMSKK